MKLTKLDKNAHWWAGTRTTWWYEDKDGVVWLIKNRERKKKEVETRPKRLTEKSTLPTIKFYLFTAAASAIGIFAAVLISKYLLL